MHTETIKIICRCCGFKEANHSISGTILGNAISYYQCNYCGYVQTENPYWLDRAYSSPINASDTGVMMRNLKNTQVVLVSLWLLGDIKGGVLDFAGGYGVLVRLLRDYGVDAFWMDRFSINLLARGFEYQNEKIKLVSAFEVFEHLVSPEKELADMLKIAPNVILSTEIIPSPIPKQVDWWYFGKDHGQHIGFFRVETLKKLAAKHGKHLVTDNKTYHLFSEHPISQIRFSITMRLSGLIFRVLRLFLKSKTLSDNRKMLSADVD